MHNLTRLFLYYNVVVLEELLMQVSNQEIVHPLYTIKSISFVGYYKHLQGWEIYEDYGITL